MESKKYRVTLYIFNGLIALICLFAIVGYFLAPLWTAQFSVRFTKESSDVIFKGNEYYEKEAIFKSVVDSLADEDVKLNVDVKLRTVDMFLALLDNSGKTPKRVINQSVGSLVNDLKAFIKSALKPALKAFVKESVKNGILESVSEWGDEKTSEVVNDLLENEVYKEKIDDLFDKLDSNELTPDSAVEEFLSAYNGIVADYNKDAEPDKRLEELAADEQTLETAKEVLSQAADENGRVSLESILNLLTDSMLTDGDIAELLGSGSSDASVAVTSGGLLLAEVRVAGRVSEEEPGDLAEELSAKIYEKLNSENVLKIARFIMIGMALLLLFTFLVWLYPIVKILAKIGSENPAIHLIAPIIFGWIPFLLLVLIPSILTLFINAPKMLVRAAQLLHVDASAAGAVLGMFRLSFRSSSTVSFICAMVLLVLSIVVLVFRVKLNRSLKQNRP